MIIAFARKGHEIGQHPEEDVPSLLASGEILPSDHYWHEGMTEWRQVYERWSEPEAPEATPPKEPAPPKASAPLIRMEQLPKAQKSGPGLFFYLVTALLVGGGLYWFLSNQQPPQQPPAVVAPEDKADETPTLPAPMPAPQEEEAADEAAAAAELEAQRSEDNEPLALAWLKENPRFKPRQVTLQEPRDFVLKRNGLVRGNTTVPAGASAQLEAWDDQTVTAGFAGEPRVLPHAATDFVAQAVAAYQKEKDQAQAIESAPAAKDGEVKLAAAVPTKSKITVIAWNIEWYPGKSIRASAAQRESHKEIVKAELQKINPDVFLAQEIRSWNDFAELCDAVPDLQLAAVSRFLHGEDVGLQQTAIASKLPAVSGWYDMWRPAANQPPRGYTAAVLEIPGTDKLLLVYSLHLKSNLARRPADEQANYDRRDESIRQLLAHVGRMEKEAFKDRIAGVIVGGDFNTNHDGQFGDNVVKMMTEAGFLNTWGKTPRKERHTWRGNDRFEPTTFDYVFVRGLEATTAELVEVSDDTSDHWPVRIELSLP